MKILPLTKVLMCGLLISVPVSLLRAEQETTGEKAVTRADEQADTKVNQSKAAESEQPSTEEQLLSKEQPTTNEQLPTNEQPQAENLKNRALGAAFRQFRPSEEISADNAVPFPVDI